MSSFPLVVSLAFLSLTRSHWGMLEHLLGGTDSSWGRFITKFLRNHPNDCHSGFTSFQSQQQWTSSLWSTTSLVWVSHYGPNWNKIAWFFSYWKHIKWFLACQNLSVYPYILFHQVVIFLFFSLSSYVRTLPDPHW